MTRTISEMEKFLLTDSKTSDLLPPEQNSLSPDTQLTTKQVQHDISAFARILINVYCGWPFYNEKLKQKTLDALLNLYTNATNEYCEKLFNDLGALLADFPDNHIRITMNGYNKAARTKLRKKRPHVGDNIAGDKKFYITTKDDTGIIAISSLSAWTKPQEVEFEKQWRSVLPQIKKLVIDLRDNRGGNDTYTNKLADHILGYNAPNARRIYVRNNPDANRIKILEKNRMRGRFDVNTPNDPVLLPDYSDVTQQKFISKYAGFNGPIYVLINGHTASSAEMFCTKIKNYPNVTFIGTNTLGCEIYGFVVHTSLPNSKIDFAVGFVHRELFVDNFELNGYSPDINVPDGTDAFDVAMQQIVLNKDKQK